MTATADELLAVMEDGERLWPWNQWVVNDEQVSDAVRRAIGNCSITADEETDGPTPHPRLLMVKPDLVAVPLIEALTLNVLWYMHPNCDRCRKPAQPVSRLWVPCSGGVVQVECCAACKHELDRDYSDLVWR